MLGVQRGTVQVVPYDPLWASLFEDERTRLTAILALHVLDIQHIGSTSVPGLAAKPILDIGIGAASEADLVACVPLLQSLGLGYTYKGDRGDEGHFFDWGTGEHPTHYVHLLLVDSPAWRNYLRFRDYLTAHPDARDSYMHLKQELAAQHAADRKTYTASKAQFIQNILAAIE